MDKKKEGAAIIERLMQAFHAACPHARKGCNALGDWCGIPGYKLRRVKNGESVLSLEDLHVISSRTGLTPDRISLAQGAERTPAEGSDVVTKRPGLPLRRGMICPRARACVVRPLSASWSWSVPSVASWPRNSAMPTTSSGSFCRKMAIFVPGWPIWRGAREYALALQRALRRIARSMR